LKKYEIIVILDPALSEEEVEGQVNDIREVVLKGKGDVTEVQKWGKKRLAYEVKKRKEGYYLLLHVNADPKAVSSWERYFKISERVLKYLTVRPEESQASSPDKGEPTRSEGMEVSLETTGGI
jgi:small subunit ribosomal protein S6